LKYNIVKTMYRVKEELPEELPASGHDKAGMEK
jgi:hypothetical protein